MKIIFLGTNGWYTSPTGNTACILVDSKKHYVIFDAGNGFYKLDQYILEKKPVSLFISHFHLDHVAGLHTLAKFNFSHGLDVYVGEGRKKDFQNLVKPPFTIGFIKSAQNVKNLKMEIRLHELPNGNQHLPFPTQAVEQFHAYRNHGYRITLEGKIIAYSGDAGTSEGSMPLAKNADLLIHECSYTANDPPDNWGHVGPTEAAKLAKEAGVKKLILTHFDPTKYLTLDDRRKAQNLAQTIFPNTTAATDDLIIQV